MTSPKIEAVAWVEVGQFCLGRPQEWELLETPSEAEDQPLYSQQTVDALLEWGFANKAMSDVQVGRAERAEAQAEANRRDAERYRWLRENDNANMLAEDVIDDAIAAAEGETK